MRIGNVGRQKPLVRKLVTKLRFSEGEVFFGCAEVHFPTQPQLLGGVKNLNEIEFARCVVTQIIVFLILKIFKKTFTYLKM